MSRKEYIEYEFIGHKGQDKIGCGLEKKVIDTFKQLLQQKEA